MLWDTMLLIGVGKVSILRGVLVLLFLQEAKITTHAKNMKMR
jgi:hypothetical protein